MAETNPLQDALRALWEAQDNLKSVGATATALGLSDEEWTAFATIANDAQHNIRESGTALYGHQWSEALPSASDATFAAIRPLQLHSAMASVLLGQAYVHALACMTTALGDDERTLREAQALAPSVKAASDKMEAARVALMVCQAANGRR